MKKYLIRTALFLLTFAIALVVASRIMNKDHDSLTMEMPGASLPVIHMLLGNLEYNPLYGYKGSMECAGQRDQITLLGESREVAFQVDTYGRNVTKIGAELRSADGSRLIETIDGSEYRREKNSLHVRMPLKDLIEQQQEYTLILLLELDQWEQVSYYTKIVWTPGHHLKEDLTFVSDFHEKLYHREAARELIKYLESNSRLQSNVSFHKVNIHSSFKQITWGDMKVEEVSEPLFTLKEYNSQAAMILVDYYVSTGEKENLHYHRVREYFRIRYTPDRMYLLAYERTMEQIPDEKNLYGGDKFLLGIGDENVKMMENEDGSVLAFQQADRLFAYRIADQKLALLFSFYNKKNEDERCMHNGHDIKILQIDEEGNVDFAVYGYMNRGAHEGEVGVLVYRYNAAVNTVEERIFIPWKQSDASLKPQMEKLLYLTPEGKLYFWMEQTVYEADLATKECRSLIRMNTGDCIQVSENHRIIVWQKEPEQGYPTELVVRDLAEDREVSIRCKNGEALKMMGFMGEDIIYGLARTEQITRKSSGQIFFPMYKLCISKADGTVLMGYSQEQIYVIDCTVDENQIILERVEWKEGSGFVATGQDPITKNSQEASGKNEISLVDIDVYQRYVQIKINGKMDAKTVQVLTPKEVIHEGMEDLLPEINKEAEYYYVYGPYGIEAIETSVGEAVNLAYSLAGTVISKDGNKIWQKGSRASRNQIMAIREPQKVQPGESMAVCLDCMLRQKGISVDSAELLAEGKYPIEILQENMTSMSAIDMTGCSLDAMLYYVNQDIPVLGVLQSGEAVLITGFNESQVVVFDPSEGKLAKRGMSDAAGWFEENGNCFLTFLP